MSRLDIVREQITKAREYTLRLLEATPPTQWFIMPAAGISHIGWQAGHLAVAEFRLTLERIRGSRPEDEKLITPTFVQAFGRLSAPHNDAQAYPSVGEIRAVLDRVHAQGLKELATLTDADLDQLSDKPHPQFTTKFGALQWCSHHEMVHAGQIGLLRRQLGHPALW